MQKSLIAVIADRYRQQDFDALTSKDNLKPADIRRICFDLGIALIISVLFQKVIFVAMVFLLRGFVSAGLDTGSTLFTVLNYTFSNISTYLPKILAFGAVYLKYRPLRRLDTQYENKSYYPLIFIPAMFAFAMWGSNITTCINYVLQLLFGVGEIENVMDAIAPSSFSSGIVTLIFTAFVAPVFEEMIYRHLLLRSLKPIGDTPAIILSALIFNAIIIPCLIPLAMKGVKYRPMSSGKMLARNMMIYGLGGVITPFIGIKIIDMVIAPVLTAMGI